MNKIRVRMIIGGNCTDYERETKVSSESGFNDFIKKELEDWGIKPKCYRFDLIIEDRVVKSKITYPILDERFLWEL